MGIKDTNGQYIVGLTQLHTSNHTLSGTTYSKDELVNRGYIATLDSNNFTLNIKTDANYRLVSWSNNDGKLYYYQNGYTGTDGSVPAPTWAGSDYGVLASGERQNVPMENATGIEAMADSTNPNSLLWLVVDVND